MNEFHPIHAPAAPRSPETADLIAGQPRFRSGLFRFPSEVVKPIPARLRRCDREFFRHRPASAGVVNIGDSAVIQFATFVRMSDPRTIRSAPNESTAAFNAGGCPCPTLSNHMRFAVMLAFPATDAPIGSYPGAAIPWESFPPNVN